MTQVSHDGILHVMQGIQESDTGLLYWYTITCKMMLNMDIK